MGTAHDVANHVFAVSVPAHLADAASEAVAALVEGLVEAAGDSMRGERDGEIARAAWRMGREKRRLARTA